MNTELQALRAVRRAPRPTTAGPRGVCFSWVKRGNCRFGDDCRYKHAEERKGRPEPMPACLEFSRGTCQYGDDCNFRHDQDE